MTPSLSQRTDDRHLSPTTFAGMPESSKAAAEVVIGLDVGTTAVKVVAFDLGYARFDSYRAAMNLFAPTGTDGREKP
jgi:hypothetical protein